MKTLSTCLVLLVLLCISVVILPITLAEDNQSLSSGGQTEIYSGSIPSGEGVVSIKAISGKLYQVPAMTPLGVIQALAGTESIETYKIGDELISKKGILTLDAIDSYSSAGEKSWFVLVNDKQLEDYLLPSQEGLNTFPLKNGDAIIFAYGNPTRPVAEAGPIVRVTIGAQAVAVTPVIPAITPAPVSTPTLIPTSTPTQVETVAMPMSTPVPQVTQRSNVTETVPEVTPVQTTSQSSSTKEKDPNQPVYENTPVTEQTTSQSSSTKEKDLNQPVYENTPVTEQNTTQPSSSKEKDPNQPTYEDGNGNSPEVTITEQPTVESTPEPEVTTEVNSTETSNTTSKSSSNHPSGQEVLFDGSFSLPSGNVNITADSGMDYEVGANTPLGLLQLLATEGKVSGMSVSDRGMRKGNILTIEGIGGYQWGDEAWFAQINDVTLQDYVNSGDGLNIKTFSSGNKITYFYGKMDQTPSSAKAAIYVNID